ncbi:RT0821/Lpp0805 family surface protein [Chelativorans sp. Marseille-P2723]|uniref:RT0821/Lpp0805 family surface protein n=1 Tax=Chelativorans sp. Marseille-P2723 TaxID=2709133 RepID=UPI001570D768|nr:RT0821/Lpp0805 family surface protein [Chelativorans sp. Marseille-P2723]
MSGLLHRDDFPGLVNLGKAVLVTLACLLAQACSGGGGKTETLDSMLVTSSVPSKAVLDDDGLAEDGQAALSALWNHNDDPVGLAWENPESGATGLITAYGADVEDGRSCLNFTTTHENFSGISLYKGKACEDQAGIMRLRKFMAL